MEVRYSIQFAKDAQKLPSYMKKAVKELVIHLENARTLFEISNCKPLEGVRNGYRIRRGDYRVTLLVIVRENAVMLMRVLSRGQVYRK